MPMPKIKRRKALDSNAITDAYFDEILLETRHIDSAPADLSLELFGHRFATPIMTAALSHIPGKDGDGMVQMAIGAARVGAVCMVGMTTLEQYATIAATGAKIIRIIKPYADEREIIARIEQAEELGAIAVGIDLDHIFNRSGVPDTVKNMPMRPQTFRDIEGYCKHTKLPFVVKDVLSLTDAQKSIDAGAGGILVSHHHGMHQVKMQIFGVLVNRVDHLIPTPHKRSDLQRDLICDRGISHLISAERYDEVPHLHSVSFAKLFGHCLHALIRRQHIHHHAAVKPMNNRIFAKDISTQFLLCVQVFVFSLTVVSLDHCHVHIPNLLPLSSYLYNIIFCVYNIYIIILITDFIY